MKNKILLLIVLVMVLVVAIGKDTYALFTSNISSVSQSYGTGTLSLSYSNYSVGVNNAYPMSDSDGMNIGSNIITITNTGTLAYKFDVKIDASTSSTLSNDLIKVSVDEQTPAILSSDGNVIIRDVILNPGSSRSFALKVWISSSATSSDVLGKKYIGNLSSSGIAVKNVEDSDGTVLDGSLFNYIKRNADTTTTIDFSQTSEATSTNGIYMTTNTEDSVPVYYYRGAVDNNHVLFANFCWRIIRTTETGGVKLIYNGVQKDVYENYIPIEESSYINLTNDTTYPYTFDSTTKTWTNASSSGFSTITYSVDTAGDYALSYVFSGDQTWDSVAFYKNGIKLKVITGLEEGTITLSSLIISDVIKIIYSAGTGDSLSFSIERVEGNLVKTCDNTFSDTSIGTSGFYSGETTEVGYMYGTQYIYKSQSMQSLSGTLVFGNDITYANGIYTLTDTYSLSDVNNWSNEYRTIASKYHYTCFTSSDSCEKVDYVYSIAYYSSSSSKLYYFELSGGKNHLDILKEVLDNSKNTDNTAIKEKVDAWYQENMTDYTVKLEDTAFCSDQSYDIGISTSGWNKDYSNYSHELYFNSVQRIQRDYMPTFKCIYTNDKYTVDESNGNGALIYPVGLITADECAYAGSKAYTNNSSIYLKTGQYFWTMTPFSFWSYNNSGGYGFILTSNGNLYNRGLINSGYGIRPVVSLKQGIAISGGIGTAESPFVIS